MTVANDTNRSGPYLGNGVTTIFNYDFRVISENHIRVIREDSGVETVLAIGADYIVSGVGAAGGGQIATTSAPTEDQTITILRDVPFTQETDLENQGAYYAETIEESLDLSVMRDQQLSERLDRALLVSEHSSSHDMIVPEPEAGKFLKWKQDLSGLENSSETTLPPNNYAIASQSEAEGGSLNTVLMTPLRTQQLIDVNKAFVNVSTRAGMAALDVTKSDIAIVKGEGSKNGVFWLRDYADYSADVTADVRKGFVVRSTNDTDYVWVRDVTDGRYMVDWFVTKGASKLVNTNELKDALQSIPDGGIAVFTRFKQYDVNEISATTRGGIEIQGNCALINNTTQVSGPAGSGLPILRVFVGNRNNDVKLDTLIITGPRSSSSTTLGLGAYGGDPANPGYGFPSGIDIPIGRKVTLTDCVVSGTYYCGIEVHYCKDLLVDRCSVSNHGYAGILFTNTEKYTITKNTARDIGTSNITDGYGITAGTSYNSPDYTEPNNGSGIISGNIVNNCKRKSIDVHNALDIWIENNTCIGAGNAFIYAVCEGKDKVVATVTIKGNKLYGSSSFLGGVTSGGAIDIGSYSGALTPPSATVASRTRFVIVGNRISGINAAYIVQFTSNDNSGFQTELLRIEKNEARDCACTLSPINYNNYSQPSGTSYIRGNMLACNINSSPANSLPFINVKNASHAFITENDCSGTGSVGTAVIASSVTTLHKRYNMFNGAMQDAA